MAKVGRTPNEIVHAEERAKAALGDKIVCQGDCGRLLNPTRFFYASKSKLYASTKRFPTCKDCIKKIVDESKIDTVYDMLRIMDVPFFYDRWYENLIKCKEKNKNVFGNYIRMANSGINEFKDATWKDSYFEPEVESNENSIKSASNDEVINITPPEEISFKIEGMTQEEIQDKWGYGYTNEEYFLFEKKYKKLIGVHGDKTPLHVENLITYIRYRVKEEIETAKGKVAEAEKWSRMADTAAKSAKMTVQQLSKSDISGGVELVPQIFEAVEDKVGIISILPTLKEQPVDDADLIIWCIINYQQRLEDKPRIQYRDIWNFYDDMLEDFFKQKGYNKSQIKEEKKKRTAIFRDLEEVYKEPLYDEDEWSEENDNK